MTVEKVDAMAGTSTAPLRISMHNSGRAAPKVLAALSVLAVLFCGISTASPVLAATPCWDISGTWTTVQGGSRTLTFTFQQNGNQVSGTAGDTSLSGTFTGNVTGDHVDVIVVWNAQRANGSTLEGEYEATISAGTLTGTTHDVANPSSHATWTATGGPTKACAGATATPTGSVTPTSAATPTGSPTSTSSPASTDSNEAAAEAAILQALESTGHTSVPATEGLNTSGAQAIEGAFRGLFSKNDDVANALVFQAGLLASSDGSDGRPRFPGVRACMPIILRMAYNGVTGPDAAARASALLAGRRLLLYLLGRDFAVTKGAAS
ncbi:hypothetical protein ACSVHC_13280 [Arthrobacter sp. KNU-44]|uniref:hypothetical protein n=1 Tax=Arthrobacter sp. KNU-44 TaxID=3450744 RepID=UPI003F42625A